MLKGKQQVAKNRNGASAHSASISHVTKKPVTKGSKKRMKKVAGTSIATNGQNKLKKCSDATQSEKVKANSRTMEEANQSLQGRAITILSDRDWDQLMDSLDNPPDPSPELRSLWQKYA